MDDADGDAVGGVAAGLPVGHLGKKPDGFHVKRFVGSLDDTDVGNVAVGVDYEAACDTSFNATFICLGRIMPVFVDVVEKGFIASGKRGFHFYIVIFKHLFVGLKAVD